MSTYQTFRAELDAIQKLIARQSSIVSSDDVQQLMSIQCEAFVQKVSTVTGLDIDAVDALTVVMQGGPWRDQHKSRLCLAFSAAVIMSGNPSKDKREGQEITAFQNSGLCKMRLTSFVVLTLDSSLRSRLH